MAEFAFLAAVIQWRGPAPFYFAVIPADIGEQIAERSREVSYGWGAIPVEAAINGVVFRTSLFPRDGTYLLPLKDKVRSQLGAADFAALPVTMTLGPPPR
jgi:hypothetical protein